MKRAFGKARDKQLATPNEIKGYYKGDYDIRSIHQRVLDHFQQEYALTEAKQRELSRLEQVYARSTSLGERKRALLEINELKGWLTGVADREQEQSYLSRAEPLLTQYNALPDNAKIARVFGTRKAVDPHAEERELIVFKFLAVAGDYITINLVVDCETEPCCSACGNKLQPEAQICPHCSVVITEFETENNYKEDDQAVSASRNTYGKSEHIHDAFIKFQGKQANKLPPEMIEDLITTVKAYNIDREQLPIDTLYQILKNKRYSRYYDEIYLIYHIITHKPLPDLSDIQTELFMDADRFISIYHLVKPRNRSNCLNVHFIRDAILRRHGRVYPELQCTSLRTEAVANEHNEVMRKAFALLDWGEYTVR